MSSYSLKKISDIFGKEIQRTALIRAEESGKIPQANREAMGSLQKRTWSLDQIPAIGAEFGFLGKLENPTVISIFNTKGGILKTTLTINLARMLALHNIKTCVVGLDLQCDVTSVFGVDATIDEDMGLEEAEATYESALGLPDIDKGTPLADLVLQSDIPTLAFIPETSELHQLNMDITSKTNREQWLNKTVIQPLIKDFGFKVIILDCSPNWNNLVTNALAASDLLISPIECKINNYNNYPRFKAFIEKFKKDSDSHFEHIYVPTRFSPTRKLSKDIRSWYQGNVPNCLPSAIREGAKGEDSMANRISLPEFAPRSLEAEEMRQLVQEIWAAIQDLHKPKKQIERPATTLNLETTP